MNDPQRDRVDPILEYIDDASPGNDLSAKAVALRLRRAAHYLDTESRRWLSRRGMERWELEVLSRLMRRGGRWTMSRLQDEAQVTAAAITNQVSKLEAGGYVQRAIDPADRRQIIVTLTDAGRQRAADVIAANNEMEQALFADIDDELLRTLAADLRAFLIATEGPIATDIG